MQHIYLKINIIKLFDINFILKFQFWNIIMLINMLCNNMFVRN